MTNEAKFCPYCGNEIYWWSGDGKSHCEECGAKFYVNEAVDSERKVEEHD